MFAAYDDYIEDFDALLIINNAIREKKIRRLTDGEFYCVNFANYKADYTPSNSSLERTSEVQVHLFVGSYEHEFVFESKRMVVTRNGLIFPLTHDGSFNATCRMSTYDENFAVLPERYMTRRRLAQNTYPIIGMKAVVDAKAFCVDLDTVINVASLPYRNNLLAELSKVTTMALNKVSAMDVHTPGESSVYSERIELFINMHTRNTPMIEKVAKDPDVSDSIMPFIKDFATVMSVDLPIIHLQALGTRPNLLRAFWEYWIGDYRRNHQVHSLGDMSYEHHRVKYAN